MYRPLDVDKRYDWCFVGNIGSKRKAFFDAVRAEYPNCFVGNAYFEEANRIYNASWLTLNLTINNDINMRFYEAQATSALMLANPSGRGPDDAAVRLPAIHSPPAKSPSPWWSPPVSLPFSRR